MCSTPPFGPRGATDDVVRALTAAVRALPEGGRGSAAAAEAEALLGLVEAATCVLLGRLAVVDADRVAQDDLALVPSAWLRRRTRGTQHAAATTMRLARRLHLDPSRPLVRTAAAYAMGVLTTAQVDAIASVCAKAPEQVVPELEATLASHPELEAEELTRSARSMVQRLREQSLEVIPQAEVQRGGRYVRATPTLDGWVRLEGMLEPEAGALLRAALDPLSAPATTVDAEGCAVHDPRAPGERMHDALVELVGLATEAAQMPAQGGARPHLQLLVDAGLLLVPPRHRDDDTSPTEPQWRGTTLEGHRVADHAVDEAACDAVASFVVAAPVRRIDAGTGPPDNPDPPGIDPEVVRLALAALCPALGGIPLAVLAAGRERRLVSAAQRRALDARDRGCVVPGCTAPARRCQAHHLVPWQSGGSTDLANLALVCAAHHRFLHRHDWALEQDADGRFVASPAQSQLDTFVRRPAA